MFTHPDNLTVLSAYEIRQSHPDISFPPTISIEHVEDMGYLAIEYDDQPDLAPNEAASFIDLEREDTRQGVLALESVGILDEGRAMEILDSPVEPHEVP